MPDDGDQIALATGFDPQHAEAVERRSYPDQTGPPSQTIISKGFPKGRYEKITDRREFLSP
jgi:hypothetical protein